MNELIDVLKERLKSQVLSNYLIGMLFFNRTVIYAALTIDYKDRVKDVYLYNKHIFTNKIELLAYIYRNDELYIFCKNIPCNMFVFPLIYAILITSGLPYIKAFLNALNENASHFYDWLMIKINKLETITVDRYNELLEAFKSIKLENDNLKKELDNNSLSTNLLQKSLTESQQSVKAVYEEKDKINVQFHSINEKYENSTLAIDSILSGIWELKFQFIDNYPGQKEGREYFKIEDGYKYLTSVQPQGEYKLRCYIEKYQHKRRALQSEDQNGVHLLDNIIFTKKYQSGIQQEDRAECQWTINQDGSISGTEDYYLIDNTKYRSNIRVIRFA